MDEFLRWCWWWQSTRCVGLTAVQLAEIYVTCYGGALPAEVVRDPSGALRPYRRTGQVMTRTSWGEARQVRRFYVMPDASGHLGVRVPVPAMEGGAPRRRRVVEMLAGLEAQYGPKGKVKSVADRMTG